MPFSMSLIIVGVIALDACVRTTAACANSTGCLLNSCDYQVQNFNVSCEKLEVRNETTCFVHSFLHNRTVT